MAAKKQQSIPTFPGKNYIGYDEETKTYYAMNGLKTMYKKQWSRGRI